MTMSLPRDNSDEKEFLMSNRYLRNGWATSRSHRESAAEYQLQGKLGEFELTTKF